MGAYSEARRSVGTVLAEVTLRPQVSMGAFQALGYVCALGAAEGLREAGIDYAAVGWPWDVVDARTLRPLATLELHAGYRGGMFATCTVKGAQQVGLLRNWDDEALAAALSAGIEARVSSWSNALGTGAGQAGPLAPILADYADSLALLGHPAAAVYPNGNVMTQGRFAGVDVWGRATLVTEDGREVEFPPEQARLQPL